MDKHPQKSKKLAADKLTHFASPERNEGDILKQEIEEALKNPLITDLLHLFSGVVMVLNQHRQIISSNQKFFDLVGIDAPEALIGLRPGEVLNCVHAHESVAGCGTAEACASCGAAMAMVTSLCSHEPVERYCALQINKGDQVVNLYFRVIATPVHINSSQPLILVCLQDVTTEHRWANLDRIFFHDVNNLLTALLSITHLLAENHVLSEDAHLLRLQQISERLAQEVSVQQYLTHQRGRGTILNQLTFPVKDLLLELSTIYTHHPQAKHRRLLFPKEPPGELFSDPGLIIRILGNMITNALEATPEGGEVICTLREQGQDLGFEIWNQASIPPSIQPRIFQRHFSTKEGFERGLGTYAMKLLGEEILSGRVEFSSNPQDGTAFTLWLPLPKKIPTHNSSRIPAER